MGPPLAYPGAPFNGGVVALPSSTSNIDIGEREGWITFYACYTVKDLTGGNDCGFVRLIYNGETKDWASHTEYGKVYLQWRKYCKANEQINIKIEAEYRDCINHWLYPEYQVGYANDLSINDIYAPVNVGPNIPDEPSGPVTGEYGQSYNYRTYSEDPEEDTIKYYWDWGDWYGFGPKILTGQILMFPWVNFDWYPSPEPYDIKIQNSY